MTPTKPLDSTAVSGSSPQNAVVPKSNPNLSAAAVEMYINREKAFEAGWKQQQRVQTLLFQEKKRETEWMAQAIRAEQKMAEAEPFEIIYPKKQKRVTKEISL